MCPLTLRHFADGPEYQPVHVRLPMFERRVELQVLRVREAYARCSAGSTWNGLEVIAMDEFAPQKGHR